MFWHSCVYVGCAVVPFAAVCQTRNIYHGDTKGTMIRKYSLYDNDDNNVMYCVYNNKHKYTMTCITFCPSASSSFFAKR